MSPQMRRSGLLREGYEVRPLPPGEPAKDRVEFAERKAALVRRLQAALLTLSVQPGEGPASIRVLWPGFKAEYDGGREQSAKRANRKVRFSPTAHEVDDMLPALALLEGLRAEYWEVIYLWALGSYYGSLDWEQIGRSFSSIGPNGRAIARDARWAKDVWERAIIQAARRDGLLPPAPSEYAILGAACMNDEGMFRTYIGTAADAKASLRVMKSQNAWPIVDAFAIWFAGPPLAKRVLEETKGDLASLRTHGSWHRLNPFEVEDAILTRAQAVGAAWRIDYLMEG